MHFLREKQNLELIQCYVDASDTKHTNTVYLGHFQSCSGGTTSTMDQF